MREATLLLILSAFFISAASLQCPSGKVGVSTPNGGYLECTNSTASLDCGESGTCEFVNTPESTQQICCIASSLLCDGGQFMYGGRCFEESDLPNHNTLAPSCTVDGDCGESAHCVFSTCQCPLNLQQSTESDGSLVCLMQQLLQKQFTVSCNPGQVSVSGNCLSVAAPGSTCQVAHQCIDSSTCNNQRCVCTTPNAKIIKGYCIVPSSCSDETQINIDGRCVSYASVGNRCEVKEQCVGGSSCVNNMCTCPSHLTSMNDYCIPNPTISSTQCTTGQALVNGECKSLVSPGDQCVSSNQCIDRSTCSSGRCQCTTNGAQVIKGYCLIPVNGCGNTETMVNNRCVSYATPGSQCLASNQCVGGSTCVSQMCICPQGTTSMHGYCVTTGGNNCPAGQVSFNGQCLSTAQLGAFCQTATQCPENAVCQGTCQCSSGFAAQNGQCVSGGTNGNCQLGQAFINGQCLSLAAPGTQCQSSAQCIDNSGCVNQRCTCTNSNAQVIKGYCLTRGFGCSETETSVNGRCLTFAQPGFACQEHQQCVGGSQCLNQVCTCPTGTTEMHKYCISPSSTSTNHCQTGQVSVNGQCVSLAVPGSNCQATAQCLDSSTCSSSTCTCPFPSILVSGYCVTPVNGCGNTQTKVNGVCVSLASPGQQCIDNQQCVAGASCLNQKCNCPSDRTQMKGYCIPTGGGGTGGCPNGQVFVNGLCVNRTPLGGQCQQAAQCGENTQCSNGVCACAFGYQQVLSSCVRSSESSCPKGQVSVDGRCVSLVSPGSQCFSSLQCIDNSNCLNSFCTCAATNMQAISGYCVTPGTVYGCGQTEARVNGQCRTFSIVGQSCIGNEQCVGGSVCMNQQCTCPMSRYSMNGYCLVNPVTGGGNCNSLTQVLVNGVCYNLVQVGQQCQISQQCIGGGQCLNSICQGGSNNGQCKTYQVSVNGQCFDTVSIGQQCTAQQQCINNANCFSNRCQCNSGSTFNGQACLSAGVFPTCSGLTVSSNGQCMQLVAMNQFCSATPQCMGFSVCTNSLCQCPYAYSLVNGICRKSTSVNNCPTGQVMSPSGACLNMVGIGGSCQINEQCPSGASCALGRCTQGSSGGLTCNDPSTEVAMANGQPINCQVQLCPADAHCEISQQQFVCCRPRNSTGGSSGYCPSNQSAELLPNGQIKNCMQQSCSSGRVCQFSSALNGYVCCGSSFG